MKLAIPTVNEHPTLNSKPNDTMEGAKSYVIYDTSSEEFTFFENGYLNSDECYISRDLKLMGVTGVITPSICNECYKNLQSQGIDVWKDEGSKTIRLAIQKLVMCGLSIIAEAPLCSSPKHYLIAQTITR